MPNSPAENELIANAFRIVAVKYFTWLPQEKFQIDFMSACYAKSDGIQLFVKFQDDPVFKITYTTTGTSKPRGNCSVCGFTAPVPAKPGDREIYINRLHANPTTIVHELFHFFTHPRFDAAVPSNITEAVTEYFTRKALGRADATKLGNSKDDRRDAQKEGFDPSGRKGRYDQHHEFLGLGRKGISASDKAAVGKHYMKRAYFQGEEAALNFVLKTFDDLEQILTLDEK